MLTCKDCIHCDTCRDWAEQFGFPFRDDCFGVEKCERGFKDKSLMVELPCGVEDTIY